MVDQRLAHLDLLKKVVESVAHDINNCLATVQLNAEIIQASIDESVQLQLATSFSLLIESCDNIQTMAEIVRQISSTSSDDPIEVMLVSDIVKSSARLFSNRLRSSGIELLLDNPISNTQVSCQPHQLSIMLMYLFTHMQIEIEAEGSQTMVVSVIESVGEVCVFVFSTKVNRQSSLPEVSETKDSSENQLLNSNGSAKHNLPDILLPAQEIALRHRGQFIYSNHVEKGHQYTVKFPH